MSAREAVGAGGGAGGVVEVVDVDVDVDVADAPDVRRSVDAGEAGSGPMPPGGLPPISRARIKMCLDSATFWAVELPKFADRMQRRADVYTISAALLSAVTSLGVWAAVAASRSWWSQAVVSAVALASAALAIVPKVKNFGETAGKARELGSQYGMVKGRLMDALRWDSSHSDGLAVRQLVADFEVIKLSKDLLVPYPMREQSRRNAEKTEKTEKAEKAGKAGKAERVEREAAGGI